MALREQPHHEWGSEAGQATSDAAQAAPESGPGGVGLLDVGAASPGARDAQSWFVGADRLELWEAMKSIAPRAKP